MMMQLVMIRPTYGPMKRWMSGAAARMTMSTIITKLAMISTWTIIRTRLGMWLRSRETARLDMAVVKITPAHMNRVLVSRLVTARAEQMPRTWR